MDQVQPLNEHEKALTRERGEIKCFRRRIGHLLRTYDYLLMQDICARGYRLHDERDIILSKVGRTDHNLHP